MVDDETGFNEPHEKFRVREERSGPLLLARLGRLAASTLPCRTVVLVPGLFSICCEVGGHLLPSDLFRHPLRFLRIWLCSSNFDWPSAIFSAPGQTLVSRPLVT